MIRVPLENRRQMPSIWTLTIPASAARSLGSFRASKGVEGVSLMASLESRTQRTASSGKIARDYVHTPRLPQAHFKENLFQAGVSEWRVRLSFVSESMLVS